MADFIGSPSMNLIKGNLKQNSENIYFIAENEKISIEIPINNYEFKEKISIK